MDWNKLKRNYWKQRKVPSNIRCIKGNIVYNYAKPHANVIVGSFEGINFLIKYDGQDFYLTIYRDDMKNSISFRTKDGTSWESEIGIYENGYNSKENLMRLINPYFNPKLHPNLKPHYFSWYKKQVIPEFVDIVYELAIPFYRFRNRQSIELRERLPKLTSQDFEDMYEVDSDRIVRQVLEGVKRRDPDYLGFGTKKRSRSSKSKRRRRRSKSRRRRAKSRRRRRSKSRSS